MTAPALWLATRKVKYNAISYVRYLKLQAPVHISFNGAVEPYSSTL